MRFNVQALTLLLDCGSAVLRVHLLGHHVLPVLLLRVGSRAGHHPHLRGRRYGALHVPHCLVSEPNALHLH